VLAARNTQRRLLASSLLAELAAAQEPQQEVVVPNLPAGYVDITASPQVLEKVTWLARGPVAEPKWTLFVCATAAGLRDQRQWLEDLQRRHGGHGVRIAVVMPPGDGKAIAAEPPAFAVGELDEVRTIAGACWFAAGTKEPVRADVDGAADLLQAAVDGKDTARLLHVFPLLEALVLGVADGGDYRPLAARLVALLPHSGRARAAAVLVEWCGTGDLVAARRQFDAGLPALLVEPPAIAMFADLVLRGDRSDPSIAKELAVAMTPVAAAAPDSPFVQLVHLRALLRAGQDKLAGRMLSAVGKLCAHSARDQVLYAETLMEANEPAPWRALAEHALDAAAADGFDPRWLAAARHKVLVRSGAPAAECDRLLADFRSASRIGSSQLNNDAWYMMVRADTMGRFDTYALGQCEEMRRQLGDQMTAGNQDTLALALFCNGRIREAIELQTAAAAGANDKATYAARLARYRNTAAAAKPAGR
jgi:hypothetical protein